MCRAMRRSAAAAMLQVLVEVLSAKARAVGSAELLRESMKCAANAWALAVALDGLDDWTLAQIRPDSGQPEVWLGPFLGPFFGRTRERSKGEAAASEPFAAQQRVQPQPCADSYSRQPACCAQHFSAAF